MTTATKGMREKMGPRLCESRFLTPSGRERRELTQHTTKGSLFFRASLHSLLFKTSSSEPFAQICPRLFHSTGFLARLLLMNVSAISANCSSAFPSLMGAHPHAHFLNSAQLGSSSLLLPFPPNACMQLPWDGRTFRPCVACQQYRSGRPSRGCFVTT